MFKRFVVLIATLFCGIVTAQPQKVNVLWPFGATSTQGLYTKQILIEANKLQGKYEFVFDPVPGAGGLISVQKAINDNKNGTLTLLSHTGAFFVRPSLYPADQYFENFKPIVVLAHSSAGLVTRNQTLESLVAKNKITFATAGAGSTTHLYAEVFVKELKRQGKDVNAVMVHFKSGPEAYMAVMGGHVDATFDFVSNIQRSILPTTTVIGVTGREASLGPPLSSIGFPETGNLQNVIVFFAAVDMSDKNLESLQDLFLTAEKAESVQRLYQVDRATKDKALSQRGDLSNWYKQTINTYTRASKGIVVD